MKGPSLEKQYNQIQEQIKERIDINKSKHFNSKYILDD